MFVSSAEDTGAEIDIKNGNQEDSSRKSLRSMISIFLKIFIFTVTSITNSSLNLDLVQKILIQKIL